MEDAEVVVNPVLRLEIMIHALAQAVVAQCSGKLAKVWPQRTPVWQTFNSQDNRIAVHARSNADDAPSSQDRCEVKDVSCRDCLHVRACAESLFMLSPAPSPYS